MTHSLGKGTCNFPLNVTREERLILGQLAFSSDVSMGEFLRRMIRRGVALSDPEAAKRLARVRRDRARCALMLSIFVGYIIFGGDMARRPRRIARIPRVSREIEIES